MNQESLFKPKLQKEQPSVEKKIVRSELNLEQNNIFTVSTYPKKSREIVIREKLPSGEVSERRAIIGKTADGVETGVLTTHHFKVYLSLLEFWEKAGRPLHDHVHFTILKIIKCLGMIDSGSEYQVIKKWLYNLAQIPIEFKNSFFLSEKESYQSLEPLTVLSYLKVFEREYESKTGKQRIRGYGEFRFHDHILANLLNNYTHPLRLDVIKEFKKYKDTAILLYTYLDRCLAFKEKYEVLLEKLFEHLDLSQEYVRKPSDRKARIAPVLKELEGKPLSTGILSYCRIHKTQDGREYKLVAHKQPYERLAEVEKAAPQLVATTEPDLVAQLRAKGLSEEQVRGLVASLDEGLIRRQLEIFPFRLRWYEAKGIKVKKPEALLYMMIRGNWEPPPNYLEAKAREEMERRAKHFILWQCKSMECEYFTKGILTPKEKGPPKSCPLCGSRIEILHEDYKEYPRELT